MGILAGTVGVLIVGGGGVDGTPVEIVASVCCDDCMMAGGTTVRPSPMGNGDATRGLDVPIGRVELEGSGVRAMSIAIILVISVTCVLRAATSEA